MTMMCAQMCLGRIVYFSSSVGLDLMAGFKCDCNSLA